MLVSYGAALQASTAGARVEVAGGTTTSAAMQGVMPPSIIPVSTFFFDAVYVLNGGDGENGSISVINADTNRSSGQPF